ncbi:hypothetical protein ACGFT2_06595 [Streptomyces sp. NPDC048514]|uniref:hypothetical protein n=1 Tax=Streptomyces sp. NPDC048514 TaxID=3365564 RepID=UPI00371C3AB8
MTTAGRFHVLLAAEDRPVLHGWWNREATARGTFRRGIGVYGDMAGARIILADDETTQVLAAWPEQ